MNRDTTDKSDHSATGAERKYRAPALEKGLDVLELLARSGAPMTTSQMAGELGRSVSELFRMVLTLEHRGFIVPAGEGRDGFTLSNKLFALGMGRAPIRTLVELALPAMSALTREIGQSCHIAMVSAEQIVVVGRIENPGDLGFAVRVGYRRPLLKAASGLAIYAFLSPEARETLRAQLAGADTGALEDFYSRAEAVRKQGYVCQPSDFSDGVTDLSAPLVGRRGAVAALTVPFVSYRPEPCSRERAVERLCATARTLSETLRQYPL